ncbi:MAG: Mur ligase family protein, partial [Candidatus Komeilibacteria bacterium]|nr:Mur ligase family protein [Candidatus Komeilibacteria bacterium]
MNAKNFIRHRTPRFVLSIYHWSLAKLAAFVYQHPSRRLKVIGITGTNGKSSTVLLTATLLRAAGFKVGFSSTISFSDGDRDWLNNAKMTMVGRLQLQKLLKQMIDNGCDYAIIETSSEGIAQYRHSAIDYDVAVFTNLTPEHIEAHGSFDKYKKAKLKLFQHLTKSNKTPKIIVANLNDKHAPDFLNFPVDKKIGFGFKSSTTSHVDETLKAEKLELTADGSRFKLNDVSFIIKLVGKYQAANVLAATAVAYSQGVSFDTAATALQSISGLPGRMEFIKQGQPFKVIVDYAPEPESLQQTY